MKVKGKKTKFFWLYMLGGALLAALGVLFMPFWRKTSAPFASWGSNFINLIIAVCIVAYVGVFLLKRVKNYRASMSQILAIVEIVLMMVIAVACVLSTFAVQVISLSTCAILGVIFWCRGAVEIYSAVYYKPEGQTKYSHLKLLFAILFVTFGSFLLAKPLFSDIQLQWIVSCLIVLLGLGVVGLGIYVKPPKKKLTEEEKRAIKEKKAEKKKQKKLKKAEKREKQQAKKAKAAAKKADKASKKAEKADKKRAKQADSVKTLKTNN